MIGVRRAMVLCMRRKPLSEMEECAVLVCRSIYGGKCVCADIGQSICEIMERAADAVARRLAPDAAKAWAAEKLERQLEKKRGR